MISPPSFHAAHHQFPLVMKTGRFGLPVCPNPSMSDSTVADSSPLFGLVRLLDPLAKQKHQTPEGRGIASGG
jgi:hypothetical protein